MKCMTSPENHSSHFDLVSCSFKMPPESQDLSWMEYCKFTNGLNLLLYGHKQQHKTRVELHYRSTARPSLDSRDVGL